MEHQVKPGWLLQCRNIEMAWEHCPRVFRLSTRPNTKIIILKFKVITTKEIVLARVTART